MKHRRNHPLNELWLLCLLIGLGLINFPFVEIFNKDLLVGGFPLLFLYFAVIWPVYIGVIFVFSHWFSNGDSEDQGEP